MDDSASEDQILSWIDRDDPRLIEHLRRHPEERPRIEALQNAVGSLRPEPASLPESIGPYRPLRDRGAGGMGRVYEAEQPLTGRRVALKLLRPERRQSSRDRALFLREARALGRLDHPGIVRIFDAGQTDEGDFYIVMECVEGESLEKAARLLDHAGRLRLLMRLCEAVAHAHASGVVHRDLKSSNVLVDTTGAPRVLDFGLARMMEEPGDTSESVHRETDGSREGRSLSGSIVGTLSTMSPEQASGRTEDVGPWSDVYALGVLFYRVLLGRAPYAVDAGVVEALTAITHQEPRRPCEVDPQFDPSLEAVILRAMSKDHRSRFADAGELARAFQGVLSHRTEAASQRRQRVRRGRTALLGGLLLVAGIAGARWLPSSPDRAPTPPVEAREPLLGELSGTGYPRLSPFDDVAWNGSVPIVQVGALEGELISVDDCQVGLLVALAQQTSGAQFWTKRFAEDFVELLSRVQEEGVPEEVVLQLRDDSGQVHTVTSAMTEERRAHLFRLGRRSPFEQLTWTNDRVDVLVSGTWFRLCAVAGVELSALLELLREGRPTLEVQRAFEMNLVYLLLDLGIALDAVVDVELETEALERRVQPLPLSHDWAQAHAAQWRRGVEHARDHRLDEWPPLAPFDDLRIREDVLEISVRGRWWRWHSIEGLPSADLWTFCQEYYPKCAEDFLRRHLVGVCAAMGVRLPRDVKVRVGPAAAPRLLILDMTAAHWEALNGDA